MSTSVFLHPLASLSLSVEDCRGVIQHLIDCMEDFRMNTMDVCLGPDLARSLQLNSELLQRAYAIQETISNHPQAYGLTPSEQ